WAVAAQLVRTQTGPTDRAELTLATSAGPALDTLLVENAIGTSLAVALAPPFVPLLGWFGTGITAVAPRVVGAEAALALGLAFSAPSRPGRGGREGKPCGRAR